MEVAEALEKRAKACGADIPTLLQVYGAKDFQSIPEARYAELDAQLKRKEAKKGTPEKRDKDGNITW